MFATVFVSIFATMFESIFATMFESTFATVFVSILTSIFPIIFAGCPHSCKPDYALCETKAIKEMTISPVLSLIRYHSGETQ